MTWCSLQAGAASRTRLGGPGMERVVSGLPPSTREDRLKAGFNVNTIQNFPSFSLGTLLTTLQSCN